VDEQHRDHEEDGGFARDAFAVAAAATTPRLGFGAEDVVLGGRVRVRRRRWTAAVGVAVLAAAGVGFGTGAAGFGGATPATSKAVSKTPAQRAADDGRLAYQAITKVLKGLDPSGSHITVNEPLTPDAFAHPGMCNGTTGGFGYVISGDWTADGKVPTATTPHVSVLIEFGNPKEDARGSATETKVTLSDHSVLAGDANGSADGQSVTAVRTLPDGRNLLVFVLDAANPAADEPRPDHQVVPFPFTRRQLEQVAGDLSLKFPFADGYEPTAACPAPRPQ
jgi:hypothetical protein